MGASVHLQIYFLLGQLLALEVPIRVMEGEFENDYIMLILLFEELSVYRALGQNWQRTSGIFLNELYFPTKSNI